LGTLVLEVYTSLGGGGVYLGQVGSDVGVVQDGGVDGVLQVEDWLLI